MPKSHRYFPWANGTNRASLSAVPPSRTGSIACDGGWWWGPRADYPVWPRFDRAWDGGKSRSRRQRSKAPCSFDLGSGGVFFQSHAESGPLPCCWLEDNGRLDVSKQSPAASASCVLGEVCVRHCILGAKTPPSP